MRQRLAKGRTERKAPARLRDAAVPAVPTVRTNAEPVASPSASAEEEATVEAVRRMVEAAYT